MHGKSAFAGFGAGCIMWIVEVSGVDIPIPFLIVFGVIASGMFIYGISPILGRVVRFIMQMRFRNPLILSTQKMNDNQTALLHMPEWIRETLQSDRDNLAGKIYGRDYIWNFTEMESTEPFVEVIFTLINAAIFPMLINGAEGRMVINGSQCNLDATREGTTRIAHGDKANIRIRQGITKETADKLVSYRDSGQKAIMDLRNCRLIIQAEEPDHDNETVKLGVGGECHVEIPKK